MSLPARAPHRVARILAELTDGQFFDFPITPGAYMVNGCDPRGTALETLPDDRVRLPGPDEMDVGVQESPTLYSGFNVALSVPESRERIEEVGVREGWQVRQCDRGPIQVIELWVENRFIVELLTSAMVPAYLEFMRPET